MAFIYPNLNLGVITLDKATENIVAKPLKTSDVKFNEMKLKNNEVFKNSSVATDDSLPVIDAVVEEQTVVNEEVGTLPVTEVVSQEEISTEPIVTEPIVESTVTVPDIELKTEPIVVEEQTAPPVVAPVIEPVTVPIAEVATEIPVVSVANDGEDIPKEKTIGFNVGVEAPDTDDKEIYNGGVEVPALKFTSIAGEPLNTLADWQRALEKADPSYKSTRILSSTLNALETSQYRLDQIEREILEIQNDVEKLTMLINQLGEEARTIYAILTSCPQSALEERANPMGGEFLASANSMVNDAKLNFQVGIPGVLKKCQDLIDALKDERKIKADRIMELKAEAQEILTEMRKVINEAKQDYYDMKRLDDEATKARDIEAKYAIGPIESSINSDISNEKVDGYKFDDPRVERSVLDYLKSQQRKDEEKPISLLNDKHYSDINFDEYLNRAGAKRAA